MAVIRVLRGKASRLTQIATVSGGSHWRQTDHRTGFLVDNRPTTFFGTCHLRDGDHVTVAGVELRNEFRAYAMRNDSTGVEYLAPRVGCSASVTLALALLILLAGSALAEASMFSPLAFPLLLVGVMFLIAPAVLFVVANRNRQVNQALVAARDPLEPATATGTRTPVPVRGEQRSIPRTIAGAVVGTVGVGLIGMALLLSLMVFRDLITVQELGRGSAIVALLICLAAGIGGYTLTRWGFGKRVGTAELSPRPEVSLDSLARVRKRVLAVASDHGGRVTAAELAAELAIEQAPAQRVLEEAAEAGDARLLFTPEGDPVYEFQGLVTRKAEAKEPWEL